MKKQWYSSKTVWFGILFILIAIANLFGFADFKPTGTWNGIIEAVIGILIIWFRFTTNKAIK